MLVVLAIFVRHAKTFDAMQAMLCMLDLLDDGRGGCRISAGAWSSMQLAIRHPERCRA